MTREVEEHQEARKLSHHLVNVSDSMTGTVCLCMLMISFAETPKVVLELPCPEATPATAGFLLRSRRGNLQLSCEKGRAMPVYQGSFET